MFDLWVHFLLAGADAQIANCRRGGGEASALISLLVGFLLIGILLFSPSIYLVWMHGGVEFCVVLTVE